MQASRSTLLPWTCRRCASLSSRPIALAATNRRWLTTETTEATTPASEEAAILKPVPRWKQTPERMMAIGPHPGSKKVVPYQVNEDPEVLDAFYERLLDGRKEVAAISEEIRWVAVTHKSFDHGRRGFNERLAFLGKVGSSHAARARSLICECYRQTDSEHTSNSRPSVLHYEVHGSSGPACRPTTALRAPGLPRLGEPGPLE